MARTRGRYRLIVCRGRGSKRSHRRWPSSAFAVEAASRHSVTANRSPPRFTRRAKQLTGGVSVIRLILPDARPPRRKSEKVNVVLAHFEGARESPQGVDLDERRRDGTAVV